MKRKMFVPLVVIIVVFAQGCVMVDKKLPSLADGLRMMLGALDETVAAGLDGAEPYLKTRRPWQCDQAQKRSFSSSYDVKARDPRSVVKAVGAHWRSRGYRIQEENSGAPKHPEIYADADVFELGIVGFPERGEVWIHGNTVCLAGEVPEDWRDVR
ncbi:hypothetical protein ACQP1V_30765 [Microtetraspora malaysiensis]|uniref:hypothetical protein n=1 Tax=Microtetraspora malaysiensis TaxID=161358 RepID=UPI003D8F6CB3